jgi:NADP-dependent 3-hydroxy acid dehydrogenase YdfG
MGFMPGTALSHATEDPPARRVAVVTGASSGIGAATATRLAAEGFDVVVGARRVDRLESLATSIGARSLPLDVTDASSVSAFAAALDRVDVLVNNAGGAFDAAAVADADLDSWARTYDVNVLGTVRVTKALLPALRASGAGDVLFVGSTAGLTSAEAAGSVYRGVREPLVAEDVADCIAWALTRPHHVNIDLMVVRPRAQAARHKVHRR